MDDRYQLLCGPGARIIPWHFRVDDVLANTALDHLGSEPIEGTAAGRRLLEHDGAAGLLAGARSRRAPSAVPQIDKPLDTDVVAQDGSGAVADAYRPGWHAAILLRPGGHIAWRSSCSTPDGLIAWLREGALSPAPTRRLTLQPADANQ